ncbi:hypothetical protein KQI63_13445 [bacterium]|nr:hypothetical protein [bacterium]
MNSWREFVQRWILKSAIKQGRKSSKSQATAEASGILLLFPRDKETALPLFQPVRDWLNEREEKSILAVVPEGSELEARTLHTSVKTIVITEDDITRSYMPSRDLRRHLAQSRSSVTLLIETGYEPFTESLYAIAPSRFKCALFHPARDSYTDLLVQPRKADTHVRNVQFLLDALSTFAGNRVPTRTKSDANQKAAERFSHPQEEDVDPSAELAGSPPA